MFECPICMEQEERDPQDHEDNGGSTMDMATTKCGHAFHTSCLVTYALYHSHQSTVQCPLCREAIGEQTDIMLERQTDAWVAEIRRRRDPQERRDQTNSACIAGIVCFWVGMLIGVLTLHIVLNK